MTRSVEVDAAQRPGQPVTAEKVIGAPLQLGPVIGRCRNTRFFLRALMGHAIAASS